MKLCLTLYTHICTNLNVFERFFAPSQSSSTFPKNLFIPSHFFRWIRQYLHSVVCTIRSKVKSQRSKVKGQRLTIRNELFTFPFSLFILPLGGVGGGFSFAGLGMMLLFPMLILNFSFGFTESPSPQRNDSEPSPSQRRRLVIATPSLRQLVESKSYYVCKR